MKKNNPKRQNTYPVVLSNLVSIDMERQALIHYFQLLEEK